MNELNKLMDRCSSKFYLIYSSLAESDWNIKSVAKEYLNKYWLSQEEYEEEWKSVQDQIFINQDKGLPEMIFSDDYNLLAIRGGVLFEKVDFENLQACFLEAGEKDFVIIENTFGKISDAAPLRMKYPSDITWEELMSGNFISSVLFESAINEYFVFGQTKKWAKYSANEYENPLDIIGFKSYYADIFQKHFKQSNDEWKEIYEWLPPAYRNRIDK